jgi:hypothetical protein
MQVYLPEEMYRRVKEQKLPVSELLQETLRCELDRLEKIAGARRYVDELIAEFGEPSPDEIADARRIVAQILGKEFDDNGVYDQAS